MTSLNYTEENRDIAQTILAQLGGNRFAAMTGASKFTVMPKGLRFAIGRNAKQINRVTVTLNCRDLYDVTFEKVSMSRKTFDVTVRQVVTAGDVYAEDLQDIFTASTGLYTSL